MKIEKADIAGWRVIDDDNNITYFGEYHDNGMCEGVIYKDVKAFETGNGVCYVNEYGFENSDQNDGELFEFSAKMAVASEIYGNPYWTKQGYTRQDFIDICNGDKILASVLFEEVAWQSLETLYDEWQRDDI